ncbi:hypothetical protein CIW48_28210 [Methylobacterium sp. P1-11]|uniref:DUF4344 domain-containing metallopeptidase n=1 Tax=Methylobacterium sp. P1-11 TaxID=2024616 RepID=UPI0011EF8BCA|nr:DUF4344 domain-containing metallopeptidase [Methylobacterium sp. P1-11]KAA0115662.1 hypothetical protein CIW48_28210 [Methylobacterium sp. P1-11]
MRRPLAPLGLVLILAAGPTWARQGSPIRIAYQFPKASEAVKIYREMRSRQVLEGLREIVSLVRLPRTLTLRLSECNGEINAWYEYKTATVTVCYEYIQDVWDRAQKASSLADLPRHGAIVGPIAQVFLHETGHALFHLLDVPVLGHEEDAADQFAALVLLRLRPTQARQVVAGIATLFASYGAEERREEFALADDHGLYSQRLYSLRCLAYGSDRRTFGYLVEDGDLPKERVVSCRDEYGLAANAMDRLFHTHLHKGRMERERIRRGFHWVD